MRCVHSNFVIANVAANTGTVLTTITNILPNGTVGEDDHLLK